MFADQINETPLSTTEADAFFGEKVSGGKFYGDSTFLSTLRALIYPRIKDTERGFCLTQYSVSDVEDIKTLFREREDSLTVYGLSNSLMDDIEEKIKEVDEVGGFIKIKKITEFFVKSFRVYCYVKEDARQCVLLVSPLTLRVNHYLQCAVVAFLPWYFRNAEGKFEVSKLEMDLIQSLRDKNSSIYREAAENIANTFDIRSAYVKQELHDVGNVIWKQRLKEVENEIYSYREQIKDLRDKVSDRVMLLEKKLVEELGLKAKTDTPSDDIMNLFLDRKNLILIPGYHTTISGDIVFAVRGYLDFYDEDAAEAFINNEKSVLYDYSSPKVTLEGQKRIFKELFIRHDYGLRIRICAEYKIAIGSGRVYGIERPSYPPECSTYMPNPHIDRYGCLGNNERIMVDCLGNGDFVGCIEQCMSSCYGLNFHDTAVMREFVDKFFGSDIKCIELPSGEVVDVPEALEWIAEKEKEKENE